MERYSWQEAQDHLLRLIAEALRGKTVVITDENDHAVQLTPVAGAARPRKAGSARGQIIVAEDFDAPLADFDEYMA